MKTSLRRWCPLFPWMYLSRPADRQQREPLMAPATELRGLVVRLVSSFRPPAQQLEAAPGIHLPQIASKADLESHWFYTIIKLSREIPDSQELSSSKIRESSRHVWPMLPIGAGADIWTLKVFFVFFLLSRGDGVYGRLFCEVTKAGMFGDEVLQASPNGHADLCFNARRWAGFSSTTTFTIPTTAWVRVRAKAFRFKPVNDERRVKQEAVDPVFS